MVSISVMSCAKTAKPIEMQFGMLSQVGPGNMYFMGIHMPSWEGALLEVYGRLKSVVKNRILGDG